MIVSDSAKLMLRLLDKEEKSIAGKLKRLKEKIETNYIDEWHKSTKVTSKLYKEWLQAFNNKEYKKSEAIEKKLVLAKKEEEALFDKVERHEKGYLKMLEKQREYRHELNTLIQARQSVKYYM